MKRVVIVATNNGQYNDPQRKTGLWLTELTHFYSLLKQKNYEMDIISPKGGRIPLEPKSLKWPFMDREAQSLLENKTFMDQLSLSLSVRDVKAKDYGAIFFTGGHGVMWDLPVSDELAKLAANIYEAGGYVSAVCHGVCALFNIKLSTGERLIQGKKLTGFSNLEEYLAWLQNRVPYFLEEELILRGAHYSKAFLPMFPYCVVDERLITGQNPNSTKLVAKKLIEGMENQ